MGNDFVPRQRTHLVTLRDRQFVPVSVGKRVFRLFYIYFFSMFKVIIVKTTKTLQCLPWTATFNKTASRGLPYLKFLVSIYVNLRGCQVSAGQLSIDFPVNLPSYFNICS